MLLTVKPIVEKEFGFEVFHTHVLRLFSPDPLVDASSREGSLKSYTVGYLPHSCEPRVTHVARALGESAPGEIN